MTLTKVFIICAVIGLILTLIVDLVFKKRENWLISYIQNFCGTFFLFSGLVKAVDPLGLAYKMDQYFAEFQDTFARAGMEGISNIFPWFASISTPFSVFMIVLELAIGVALIIGFSRFLSSLSFFLLVVFFTFLTGFTHLTGYVPGDDYVSIVNSGVEKEVLESEASKLIKEGWVPKDTTAMHFFKFSKWVPFDESNQKVTDCGCFGDYLVLTPLTSFRKDLVLFLPALLLLFGFKKMHQLFKPKSRTVIIGISTVAFLIYNLSNYMWDIPANDFRPFKNGVNIAKQKALETEAAENAPVSYVVTNKTNGETVKLAMDEYINKYKDYPKDAWDIKQERGEPAVKTTKISDFECSDVEGNDVTDDILSTKEYSLMLVSYKLKHDLGSETISYNDTTFVNDTIKISKDSIALKKRMVSVEPKTKNKETYLWDNDLIADYKTIIQAVVQQAKQENIKAFIITAYASKDKLDSFKNATGFDGDVYTADDILLKTIVRSNPGILLMKDGTIVQKWHKDKLPSFDEIKTNFIK